MILFIAMVGAIVLTLRKRDGVKRQSIARQTSKPRDSVIKVKKVQPRQGAC